MVQLAERKMEKSEVLEDRRRKRAAKRELGANTKLSDVIGSYDAKKDTRLAVFG